VTKINTDVRTVCGEQSRCCPPDTTGSSRDQCALACNKSTVGRPDARIMRRGGRSRLGGQTEDLGSCLSAQDCLSALIADERGKLHDARLSINLVNGRRCFERITDEHRRAEFYGLRKIERSATRQLHADKCGQQAGMQKAVRDGPRKLSACRKLAVEVECVVVPRQLRERSNVL